MENNDKTKAKKKKEIQRSKNQKNFFFCYKRCA